MTETGTPFPAWKYLSIVAFVIAYGTLLFWYGLLFVWPPILLILMCLFPLLFAGLIGALFRRSARPDIRLMAFAILGSAVWLFLVWLLLGWEFNLLNGPAEGEFGIPNASFLYDYDSWDGSRWPSGIFCRLSFYLSVLLTAGGWSIGRLVQNAFRTNDRRK
jgi:hypothetical protein